jgi:hypothetical protein
MKTSDKKTPRAGAKNTGARMNGEDSDILEENLLDYLASTRRLDGE